MFLGKDLVLPSTAVGACDFSFNLHNAYHDIQSGRIYFSKVGASEAPLTPL